MTKCKVNLDNIPQELKERHAWLVWRLEPRKSDGKLTKVPYQASNPKYKASSTNPKTWSTFEQAAACWQNTPDVTGVGIVFDGDLAGVDLDKFPEARVMPEWAAEHVNGLDTYTEWSQSGKGVHCLAWGQLPEGGRRRGKVEMYDQSSPRFFVMTGDVLDGRHVIEHRTDELAAMHAQVFSDNGSKSSGPTSTPTLGTSSLDDAELLTRARNASNGAKFEAFWSGDWSGYPSQSEADLALCGMLAFWTGGDPAAIDRLFRQSGLMRDKWERPDYLARTIDFALSGKTEFYTPGRNGNASDASAAAAASDDAPVVTFHNTDLGNALRLVAQHGANIRYCHHWGAWLTWDGQRWQRDETGEIHRLAEQTVTTIYAEASQLATPGERKNTADWAKSSESRYRLRAMVDRAQHQNETPVTPGELDADPWFLNVQNGVLDLRSGDLRPHQRGDLFTKLVPVDYDPAATCPQWISFLRDVLPDPDLRAFLCRAVGYSLTGVVKHECLFFAYGTGNNGKTTFFNVLFDLLADYAQKMATEVLTTGRRRAGSATPDLARLPGVRLVVAAEVDEGGYLAESLVKDLTGRDKMTARGLHQAPFDFDPTHKIWLYGNHKPIIRGTDDGIWRRVHLLPFTVTIPKEKVDTSLPDKLKAELPGILAWAVRGCLDWQARGLSVPSAVDQATGDYRRDQDELGRFLDECCVLADGATVTKSALYEEYQNWGGDWSKRYFGGKMRDKGFAPNERGTGNVAIWRGLGLLSDEE